MIGIRWSWVVPNLALGLLLAAALPARAAPLIFAGPSALRSPSTPYWTETLTQMDEFRAALDASANFGAGGTVSTEITTTALSSIGAGSLAGVSVFVAPAWFDTDALTAQRDAVRSFFLAGGGLWLMDDSSSYDPMGERLGIPTSSGSGSNSNGTSPMLQGPFGNATDIRSNGLFGQLTAADITATGGHIGATNVQGEITVAYWRRGEYAAGAGPMIITTDVDMIRENSAWSGTSVANGEARFALNSAAFFVSELAVPEPATLGLACAGALAAIARRSRRTR